MRKHETVEIVRTDLLEHPAVQAWRELRPARVEPDRIEILKGKLPLQTKKTKRLVFRLVGVGPAGSAVIGKRCWHSKAVIESTVYKEILPYIPIPSLNFYGLVDDANGKFCWLFLEDAGEEAYSAHVAEHRALGAKWLGLAHTYATHVAAPACLPSRGPRHYLKRLRLARDGILRDLVNVALQADDLLILHAIVGQCDTLESRWDRLAEFCDGIPWTLVHGDFAAKNLRVRQDQVGVAVLPFDWGEAGWGVPATDIMHVDITPYCSVVRGQWPWLNAQSIERLVLVGRIFRCLDAISWEVRGFTSAWLETPMNNMRIYHSGLTKAIRAARLES